MQQQIDLTKAQLELDQDELEDVKGDLIRSGVDRLSRIQRQFNRHEATQKEYETNNPQSGAGSNNSNSQTGSSAAITQFSAWSSLRGKTKQLQQALDEARQAGNSLKQSHEALQSQVAMEVSNKEAIAQKAKSRIEAASGDGGGSDQQHGLGDHFPAPDFRRPERSQRSRQAHSGPGRSGNRLRQLD